MQEGKIADDKTHLRCKVIIEILGKPVRIGGFYGIRTDKMPDCNEYRGTVESVNLAILTLINAREYTRVDTYKLEPTKNKFDKLEITADEISYFMRLD